MNRRRTPRKLVLPEDRQRSATERCNAWLESNLAYYIAMVIGVMLGVLIYLILCCS